MELVDRSDRKLKQDTSIGNPVPLGLDSLFDALGDLCGGHQ